MNEEFTSSLTKLQKIKEPKLNNKKKKVVKPQVLPLEITLYNRAAINFLFILVFLTCIIMNMDQGALAAASIEIKQSLQLDDFQFGGLQSFIYIGIFIGQLVSPFVISRMTEKLIILISLCAIITSLLANTISPHFVLICFAKFVQGVFQIHLFIYFCVWIDTFGNNNKKSSWLSILLTFPFFSYIIGYMITGVLVSSKMDWKIVIYSQSCLLLPCVVGFLFAPEKYTDIQSYLEEQRKIEEKKREAVRQSPYDETFQKPIIDPYETFGQLSALTMKKEDEIVPQNKMFEYNLITENNDALLSSRSKQERILTKKEQLKYLIRNNSFIFFTLSLLGYLFMITGLQYWLTDYMLLTLNTSPEKVYFWFSIVMLFSPTIGSLIGALISKNVGGSSSPQALGVLCFTAFCATVVALPIPFVKNFAVFMSMLAGLLFFVGLILPVLMGQLLYTIYQQQRVIANSFCNFIFMIFAFIPSSSAYGLTSKLSGDEKFYCLGVIIYSSVISAGFLFIALISTLNQKQKERYLRYQDPQKFKNFQSNQYHPQEQQASSGIAPMQEFKSGESLLNELAYENMDDALKVQVVGASYIGFQNSEVDLQQQLSPKNPNRQMLLSDKVASAIRQRMSLNAKNTNNNQRRHLHLSNHNRLKYESVHILNGKIFIPSVLGIVNEDFYI
ncbi:major facilitator superfamily protein [Stylonychia lemnae]|uniref:Major facilitator superfamily protein n=1 Tax=Stylonychia lemnae TaxID=5949 RepID=A0A078B327_STYLE|nr:major facilitator superfamily protein [Stylonychia lemnae]|eukprot:CDW88671.1 major facilitator superfamily protein [Stylonychia lemnae]